MSKSALRKLMINKRNQLFENEVQCLSQIISKKLINEERFSISNNVLIYVDYKNEVSTIELINYCLLSDKRVAVPKIIDGIMEFYYINSLDDLSKGAYGILEPNTNEAYVPSDLRTNDLMIMPGVVFDTMCSRIGYGGGFYDRYLENYSCFYKIALAYEFQIVDEIQSDEHDIKPDMIITDQNIYIYKR